MWLDGSCEVMLCKVLQEMAWPRGKHAWWGVCLSACVALVRSCAFFICDTGSDEDAHLVGGECPVRSGKPLMSWEVHFNIRDHFSEEETEDQRGPLTAMVRPEPGSDPARP